MRRIRIVEDANGSVNPIYRQVIQSNNQINSNNIIFKES
jgi:hypothetical protein